MEEMPTLNMPVQRLKVAILPLDLPCSGPVTHSGEILTTGKSHGKKYIYIYIYIYWNTWHHNCMSVVYTKTRIEASHFKRGISEASFSIYSAFGKKPERILCPSSCMCLSTNLSHVLLGVQCSVTLVVPDMSCVPCIHEAGSYVMFLR